MLSHVDQESQYHVVCRGAGTSHNAAACWRSGQVRTRKSRVVPPRAFATTYTGPFTPDPGGSAFNAIINLTEDSSFNLTGTVTSTDSCFSNLTVNSNGGASLASGNVLIFYGEDLNGNLIGFVANSGGSADSPGDPTMTNVFFTAVAYSGSCNGQSYTDGPFSESRHQV
jgi:hypothetical protein